ncbi:MAG: glycoside hydrolase family 15 protein [Acidobacteriota bacterium]
MSEIVPPIGDYGAIGDCRTIALVSREGAIDWWCPPRFDAPSVFARILDRERGGSLHLWAEGLRAAHRRYLDDSAVLETTLETSHGRLVVTDFLAVSGRAEMDGPPAPYARQKLVRLIRAVAGAVDLRVVCSPRPGYGRSRPRLTLAGPPDARRRCLMINAGSAGRDILLGATSDWAAIHDSTATIELHLAAGDELGLLVDYGPGDLAGEGVASAGAAVRDHAPALDELHRWLDETLAFWRSWLAFARLPARHAGLVRRSAITLKLLTYHPSGAIVAAGTTSLPEEIGGERNWDYRFTWLRDASFTLYALTVLGYRAEADAFMSWLVTSCRQHDDPLVLYRVDGTVPGVERIAAHLRGYASSRPVRIGNAAARQRQHDIYGEVLDAAYLAVTSGLRPIEEEWLFFARMADLAARRWRRPDDSIWEVRGGQKHFTYSTVLCWVALDRIRRIAELTGRADTEAARLAGWRREAAAIREEVHARCKRSDGAFVQSYDSEVLDASALAFPLVGFVHADAPSVAATVRAVQRELTDGGLVRRYQTSGRADGLRGNEGYFLICSYWLCDNLALLGRLDEAHACFERLGGCANDLGLFSEEWDSVHGQALGNLPQAFSHIALISSAHNLDRAARGRLSGHVRSSAPGDVSA